MNKLQRLLLSLFFWPAVASFAGSMNSGYLHRQANIFPVTSIKVDGDLGDWKPAMFVQMVADEQLKDVYALRIAFGYDDQGLLVAAEVTDTSPLVNHIDPNVAPDSGWNGDALQLRFYSEPTAPPEPLPAELIGSDKFAHCTLWYFTEGKVPALDVRYGMSYQRPVTRQGAASGCVYRKSGRGYTLEGRIPWELLKAKPASGATWRMTLQMLFNDATGKVGHNFFDLFSQVGFHFQSPAAWGSGYFVKPGEVAAKLAGQQAAETALFAVATPESQTKIAVKYRNPAKGFVSLAISRPDGGIVRTLLAKASRDAGPQSESWDGLDDDGQPVVAGEYRLKALTHPGIKPKFVVSVHSAGTPPWKTADGTGGWGGDHGVPLGAAHDEQGHTYLLWHVCEAADALIAVNAEGKKLWGVRIGWDALGSYQTALTYADGVLYVGRSGYSGAEGMGQLKPKYTDGIVAFDAPTGRRLELPGGGGKIVGEWNSTLSAKLHTLGSPTERLHGGKFPAAFVDAGDSIADLVALAASSERVYASLYLEDKIVAYDRKTMELKETIAVPKPAGLAYDAPRKILYAISGNEIVMVRSTDFSRNDPVAHPEAEKIPTKVGTTNAVTPFITSGLEYPTGLALDATGNLFVAVRGMQMQVRVFSPGGKFLRTIGKDGGRPWVGKYDERGMLMPAGITVNAGGRLWVTEADDRPKRVSVWDAKTGKFLREYFGGSGYAVMAAPDPEKPEEVYVHNVRWIVDYKKGTARPDATVWRNHWTSPSLSGPGIEIFSSWRMSSYKGHKLAYNTRGALFSAGRDVFQPFFFAGSWDVNFFPGKPPAGDEPNINRLVNFYWRDQNSDGLIQLDEITRYPRPNLNDFNCGYFGGDIFPGGVFILGEYNGPHRFLFRPTGADERGLPVYPSADKLEPIYLGDGPMSQLSQLPFQQMIYPSFAPGSGDYQLFYGLAGAGDQRDGNYGPREGLYKFDRQGRILWRYARVALGFGLKAPLARPGDLFGALKLIGVVQLPRGNGGEIVGVGCYRGYFGLLNEDGLFVDQIGYDLGRGPEPSFDTFFIENFSGCLFRHPRTGKVYLFCGDTDARILELQGWEKIRRFDAGKVSVSPQEYQQVVAASTSRGGEVTRPLGVTAGAPGDWSKAHWTNLPLDETRTARVALTYDANNLYAAWEVPDENPWINKLDDWRLVFKTGDAVDIQLGLPNADPPPAKRKAQPADLRVLIAPGATAETATVVAMWAHAPAGVEKQPFTYKSPTGTESFEHVVRLDDVIVHVERAKDHYRVEATLPWRKLALSPPVAGSLLQGDLGVLLSDSGGRTAARRYLFNKDTAVTFDITTEVRVDRAAWGTLSFE